ncbi:hypothetical protein RclHR1_01610005 [Rhizophagus clarus]|uniref:Uncharacterized protein n=1 Tax=Rhizophagus clarus TaxID=94130 RepID=A0A2Z6QVZ6_9GLOM|nr:hypothetical protein RclHR1_01610005 [Rhizophagus clarus]
MTENHQTSNKQGHNEASLNANNSELQGKSSQLIQKFDKMSTKKIDSMAISSKQENLSTDNFNMIIDEINDFIHKLKNKGIGWKLEKQKVIEYFNDHKINLQESYHCVDNKKAFQLFINASEKNHILAQYFIGYCYENGIGIKKDSEKAFCWYEKAANNGNIIAICNLGLCYKGEIGVQKDYNKAFILFKQSAERGFSGGVMMLGYCYDKGIGITVDKQKAFELYQNAANLGDHVAQKNLVLMYEKRKRNYKRHE